MAFARRDGDHKPVGGPSARLISSPFGASPAILLWSGLIMQGLVAGIVVVALPITARTLRPGETGFLVSTIRPLSAGCRANGAMGAGSSASAESARPPDLGRAGDSARTSGCGRN